MERELKIVVLVFLLFFIYGLTSLVNSGDFVTPVFLNQLVLLFIAILFFVLNIRVQHSWLLLLYVGVQFLSCLIDGFTVGFIVQKTNANWLIEVYESKGLTLLFLICYFGFLLLLTGYLFYQQRVIVLLLLMIAQLFITITLLYSGEMKLLTDLVFMSFLLIFVIAVQRFLEKDNKVLQLMSYQLMLLLLLEGMEHF